MKQVEKQLRAMAKRYRSIRFSAGLAIMFLMLGINAFAEEAIMEAKTMTRPEIGQSLEGMAGSFERLRAENNKLLSGAKLELIQLMEQGDQVVKSPWSSWQFGLNYMYNNWRGSYKGRGDKKDPIFFRRNETDPYARYVKGNKTNAFYGRTELTILEEEPKEIEVAAGIRPKKIDKGPPTFVPQAPAGSLPPFSPKIITPPKAPEVDTPDPLNITPLVFQADGANPRNEEYSWWNENFGDVSQISMEEGTFFKTVNSIISKGYYGKAAPEGNGSVALAQPTLGAGADPNSTTVPNNEYRLKDGTYNNNNRFFLTLLKTPYSYFGEKFRISASHGNAVIDLETEGVVNVTLAQLKTAGFIDDTKETTLNSYRSKLALSEDNGGTLLPGNSDKNSTLYFNNKGTVELGGANTQFILTTTHNDGYKRVNIIENSGNIIGMNDANAEKHLVFYHSPDTGEQTSTVYVNTGTVALYSKGSVASLWTSGNLQHTDVAFINDGEINLYGEGTIGMAINEQSQVRKGSNFTLNKPFHLYGDNAIGLYIKNDFVNNTTNKSKNTVRISIGEKNNENTYDYIDENGATTTQEAYGNGDKEWVEKATGIVIASPSSTVETELWVPEIKIEKFSKKGVGIYTLKGKLKVEAEANTENHLNINGGEDNIGLYSAQGEINYKGNIVMGGSDLTSEGGNKAGTGNIGIFATNGKTITLDGKLKTYNDNGATKDGIGAYTDATTVDLKGITDIKLEAGSTGKSVGLYSKNASGVINVKTEQSKVHVDGGSTNLGTALFAQDGGKIEANATSLADGLSITVNNGAAAIASMGGNALINAKYSTIDYSGKGYALYASNNGKIDVSNALINLRGQATAFEKDVSVLTSPLTLTGVNIKVYSNDVTIMNLRNVPHLTLSTLNTDLSGYTGGVTHSAGVEGGVTYNKYKIAAADGLNAYNVDVDLDKSIAVDDANASTNDYQFTRRLSVQRAKMNLKSGKNVKAILSGSDLAQIGDASVVGLSMNSSKYAASNSEAAITMEANSSIKADRTDSGNGAVGLYINYGKVDTDATATIDVEKEANVVNDGAVGIYSVNGSEVNNKATVNVGGKNSIGLLGIAYRTDAVTGNVITNEFGSAAPNQGQTRVENEGKVSLDGEGATGIFIRNNNASAVNATARGTNEVNGEITVSGNHSTGMSGEKALLFNGGHIYINGQESVGMFAKDSSSLANNGTIHLADSISGDKPNIGMFTEDTNTNIHNLRDILGGNNTFGIYGKTINHGGKIKVGDNSVGMFSDGEYSALGPMNVSTLHTSEIEVGANQSVGVFAAGKNQNILLEGTMKIGDHSFGVIVQRKDNEVQNTQLHTKHMPGVSLGTDAVYIYSTDGGGTITNETSLTSTGDKNYGIYAAGTVENVGDIDFSVGKGNIGIYSIYGGTAKNGNGAIQPTIKVGESDTGDPDSKKHFYAVGMAAGYTDPDTGVTTYTGNVENYGAIEVTGDGGIGMYATGSGSKAINHIGAKIELSGKGSRGMYLDNGAVGENWGTIETAPTATKDGIIGVIALNNSIFKNYGTVRITTPDSKAVYLVKAGTKEDEINQTSGIYTGSVTGNIETKKASDTSKDLAGIQIKAPGNGTATISRDGKVVVPTYVDTVMNTPNAPEVKVGATTLDLTALNLNNLPSLGGASSIGMYVDTSGVNYTNPIQGLEHLTGLKKVNLIFGTEAARYTSSKEIQVGANILSPYNKAITNLSASQGGSVKFSLNTSSLTWMSTGTQDPNGDEFNAVYLVKIPYTAFAKDQNTKNFLSGLEERYGVEGIGSREKKLFDKLNDIGKGEPQLLAQAIDEMKGHQYANVQQRIQATENILDKEFDYLRREWQNPTKDGNKMKTFGTREEYKTNTAGIIDYKSNAYGVAYVHENETVKLGNTTGWYTGFVHNRFQFRDIGKSKEEMLQAKLGIFRSKAYDDNSSLNWTTSGEIFVGHNQMKRKFFVVNEVFGAKSRYWSYGLALNNEVSKTFRTSESTFIRPYGELKLEYGRFQTIKEKSGEMRLEVKGNDYYSIQPRIGIEAGYKHYLANRGAFTIKIGTGYENELGQVADVNNKARVAYTSADWYTLRGEKEDRRGNLRTDLNLGLDNEVYGVTANIGYDTKGQNVRGGLGLRVIF